MKRAAALCFGVALLALAPIDSAAVGARPVTASDRFVAPPGDMVMARTLIRELSDGKQILVKRSYRIRFARTAQGYRVDGDLIGVEVDAPPVLASLIDLEKRRVDTGLFPLQLDTRGMLARQNTEKVDMSYRAELQSRANAILARNAGGKPDPASTAAVARIATRSPNSPWPQDLFHPVPGERQIERTVTLSDGRSGKVLIVVKVGELLPCGIPLRFERVVTTLLGGSSMVSHEVYTFAMAPQ